VSIDSSVGSLEPIEGSGRGIGRDTTTLA
jgi:hypothetical protein